MFNFILGSDYIMLSEETATSANWLNTIKWLKILLIFRKLKKIFLSIIKNI